MKSEFVTAITQLAAEKGVPREMVMEAIQQALVSAYKHDQEDSRLITAEIDNESGEPHVNSSIAAGQRVAVLGRKAHAAHRSERGIAVLGPRHFGFDLDYVPIEKQVKSEQ